MWSYNALADCWRFIPQPPPTPKRTLKAPKRVKFTTWRGPFPESRFSSPEERLRVIATYAHWTQVVYESGTDKILYVRRDWFDWRRGEWLRRWREKWRHL
jgi:hypothetical protein